MQFLSKNYSIFNFFRLDGWSKGVAIVNGLNLGRYWPQMGPQQTLYIPGAWLRPNCQENTLTLFEQEMAPLLKPVVKLVKNHVINGPVPITNQ